MGVGVGVRGWGLTLDKSRKQTVCVYGDGCLKLMAATVRVLASSRPF